MHEVCAVIVQYAVEDRNGLLLLLEVEVSHGGCNVISSLAERQTVTVQGLHGILDRRIAVRESDLELDACFLSELVDVGRSGLLGRIVQGTVGPVEDSWFQVPSGHFVEIGECLIRVVISPVVGHSLVVLYRLTVPVGGSGVGQGDLLTGLDCDQLTDESDGDESILLYVDESVEHEHSLVVIEEDSIVEFHIGSCYGERVTEFYVVREQLFGLDIEFRLIV